MKKKKESIFEWGKRMGSKAVEAKKKWDAGADERRKAELTRLKTQVQIEKQKAAIVKQKTQLQNMRSQNQPSFGFGGGFGGEFGMSDPFNPPEKVRRVVTKVPIKKKKKPKMKTVVRYVKEKQEPFQLIY